MPVAAIQRNASPPLAELALPTIVTPSGVTPQASLWKTPSGRSPRPAIPPAGVQTNASISDPLAADEACPTTTFPSSDSAFARAYGSPPGRSPRSAIPPAGV
jgi:hypothetical protein